MRHRVKKISLNMPTHERVLLIKNLVTDLITHGKIKTTEKRAKLVVTHIEKLITYAKTHTKLIALRRAKTFLTTESASKKLLDELVTKYKDLSSGFVRVTGAGFRAGDSAPVCYIELI